MARASKKTADDDAHDEAPRWRVNEKSFVGHSLIEEGGEVTYEPAEGGEVGENLSPLNDAAQAIVDAQKSPHPDKSDGKPVKSPKAAADAASAGVGADDDADLS